MMDPNTVVLEISSDEDTDWNDCDGRGIADGEDVDNWLAVKELLDDLDKENYGDDLDVVEVSEVAPSEKPGRKSKLKFSLVDLDDDCVILDNDPDKPVEVRNDNPGNGNDDSDDILVVSEKGQVACRDYPHSRHLCIKFPFATTPNQNHCHQCYCYVCDSLAPCVYWGNGSATTDHCHATDKDEFWKRERKNTKNGGKGVPPVVVPKLADLARASQLHPFRPGPGLTQPHVQIPRPGFNLSCHLSPNFQSPNRIPVFASRTKLHQDLASKYMFKRNRVRRHPSYNLGTQIHEPVFKRTDSKLVGVATTDNRHQSHRGNLVNIPRRLQKYPFLGSLQSNPVNPPVPYPPQSQNFTPPTVNPVIPPQPQFFNHPNPNVQPQVNSSPFYQPPSSSQPQISNHLNSNVQSQVDNTPSISVSDYTQVFPEAPGPAIDNGLSWPTDEVSGPTNESTLEAGSVGLSDYGYDWIFDNQPVEPGFIEAPGSYDFSSDYSFIDTGLFDF